VVLPVRPNTGVDDTRGLLGDLLAADDDAGRIFASAIFARVGDRADPVYVHAKVGIVDDAWLTIGSANLNEHSLFNDTEMNVVTHDPQLALDTRLRLWSEHLELPVDRIDGDPTEVIETLWKPIAHEQLERRSAGPGADTPDRLPTARLPGVEQAPRPRDGGSSSTAERFSAAPGGTFGRWGCEHRWRSSAR